MDVAEFIPACVEYAGGLADRPEEGLVEALVPEALRSDFPDRDLLRLALNPLVTERYPDAIPALPGSQTLDTFIHYALQQGRLSHAFPRLEALRPRNIAGDILAAMKFTAGRVRMPEADATVEQASVVQFDFIVSLASDEKEEGLRSVVVDLWTGLPCPVLSQTVAQREVVATGQPASRRTLHSIPDAYQTACAALTRWMEGRIARHQTLIARRLQDECGRLTLYYHALMEDLERRVQRAEGGERATALQQKIEATREEETSKLAELAEKYRLRPSARLVAGRVLTYSRLFSVVLLDRRQGTRELTLCWDPLLGRLRLPACEACGQETAHLEQTRENRLLCPRCVAEGASAENAAT